MPGPLESVVALQTTLNDLASARERLHGIPDWMRELHEEHAAYQRQIEELEEAIADAGSERRAAEGEVSEAREKLKRYQQQINAVNNQREYGALLQEIDTVKRQISEGEERGLAALERADQLQQQLTEKRDGFRELDERYHGELARWEAQKPEVASQVAALEAREETLRSGLPRPVLSHFDRLRTRLAGAAVAPVRKTDRSGKGAAMWHCGACNYRVRPQVVVEVANSGSLVHCESCQRILYIEDVPAEPESASTQ